MPRTLHGTSLALAIAIAAAMGLDCGGNSGPYAPAGTPGSSNGGSVSGNSTSGGGSGDGGFGSGTGTGTGNDNMTPAASGFDNGGLFADAALVGTSVDGQGTVTTDASTPQSDAGATPPGDGHSVTIRFNSVGLTAVFTQKGTDVTVVITGKSCPAGKHLLQLRAGLSCDSAALSGPIWDGKRGEIGSATSSITCDASGNGSATYTRSGADPTTNWTVADQNTKTDLTQHVIFADGHCVAFL